MKGERITREQVVHVAELARIRLEDDELERLRADLSEMLEYVDKLNQLDTGEIEPTFQVGEPGIAARDDEVTNGPEPDAMLANAPAREGSFFLVPKIIE